MPSTQFTSLGTVAAGQQGHTIKYLMPQILDLLGPITPQTRILDVGCGNGCITAQLAQTGAQVMGIDLDESYVELARATYPNIRFERLAADEQLMTHLGEKPFDLVVSTEVIEHLYSPDALMAGCYACVRPGGRIVISAPYHGYLKNLAIALTGKYASHHDPLWEGGHIKFFSRESMTRLLQKYHLQNIRFRGAGRFPGLWMSMVMSGDRLA